MPCMDAPVRLEEVNTRHGNDFAVAVDGVSMPIAPGGGAAVMGPPGSGKSLPLSSIASPDRVFKAIGMTRRQ